jgi:hypothetical protein
MQMLEAKDKSDLSSKLTEYSLNLIYTFKIQLFSPLLYTQCILDFNNYVCVTNYNLVKVDKPFLMNVNKANKEQEIACSTNL